MPFFDEAAYSLSLRRHHARASGITSSLCFDPSGTCLAALESSGRLTFSALCPDAPDSPDSRTLALPTIARALAPSHDRLYVAGDFGLLATAWHAPDPLTILEDVPLNALCTTHGALVALAADGYIVVLDDHHAHPRTLLAPDGDVQVIASVPHSASFIAGCADGSLRQYDLRRGRSPVRTCKISDTALTTLSCDADSTFALAGDSSFRLHTAHVPSSSLVGSISAPFLPRAAAFVAGEFYVGGSDRTQGKDRQLLRIDFQCRIRGTTPVSGKSIYAIAVHPKSGAMAAAGFSPEKASRSSPTESIDVYVNPPVRSFSFQV